MSSAGAGGNAGAGASPAVASLSEERIIELSEQMKRAIDADDAAAIEELLKLPDAGLSRIYAGWVHPALHYAAGAGKSYAFIKLLEFCKKNKDHLVAAGFCTVPREKLWAESLPEEEKNYLEMQDHYGYTPLCYAAEGGRLDVMQKLIDAGAKVNRPNARVIPLHRAFASGCYEAVEKLLCNGANKDINSLNKDYESILHFAVLGGNIDLVNKVLRMRDEEEQPFKHLHATDVDGITVLHLAKNEAILEALLKTKLIDDINKKDNEGDTALSHALQHKYPVNVVKKLIDVGADVNAQALDGETPFHQALFEYKDLIKLLIYAGADVNVRDDNNKTPLEALLSESAEIAVQDEVALIKSAQNADAIIAGKELPHPDIRISDDFVARRKAGLRRANTIAAMNGSKISLWEAGVDYDQLAEKFGLNVAYVKELWKILGKNPLSTTFKELCDYTENYLLVNTLYNNNTIKGVMDANQFTMSREDLKALVDSEDYKREVRARAAQKRIKEKVQVKVREKIPVIIAREILRFLNNISGEVSKVVSDLVEEFLSKGKVIRIIRKQQQREGVRGAGADGVKGARAARPAGAEDLGDGRGVGAAVGAGAGGSDPAVRAARAELGYSSGAGGPPPAGASSDIDMTRDVHAKLSAENPRSAQQEVKVSVRVRARMRNVVKNIDFTEFRKRESLFNLPPGFDGPSTEGSSPLNALVAMPVATDNRNPTHKRRRGEAGLVMPIDASTAKNEEDGAKPRAAKRTRTGDGPSR